MLRMQSAAWFSADINIFDTGQQLVTRLRFSWFRRSASAVIDEVRHQIKKMSVLEDAYAMTAYNTEVARATRPNPFTRRFQIHAGEHMLTLKAAGVLSRTYHLYEAEEHVGTVRPKGWSYRKVVADLPESLPMPVRVLVCFLVAILLKRAQAAGGS
ncbi:MAG: hypothetical protein RhofKO_23710 [Rhodothermales bacterium]